jgi:hypothetical protein
MMIPLVGGVAAFLFFAFLYKCTPPLAIKNLLLRFGTVNPFADQEQLYAQAEEQWRGLVVGVGTFTLIVAMLLLVFLAPIDLEDFCAKHTCWP